MMLKPTCGKCGRPFLVDSAKMTQKRVKVKCPNCGTLNWVQLPPEPPAGDQTQVGASGPPPQAAKAVTLQAWLVVHDEQAPRQTFTLKAGKQTAGRHASSCTADIRIQTGDTYMSRQHFQIEAYAGRDGRYRFALSDAGSKNGTFLNEDVRSRLRPGDEAILQDGDCIQAGRTKIIFKTGPSAQQVAHDVGKRDFGKTIIV